MKKKIIEILEFSALSSLIFLILNYLLNYKLISNGLSNIELALMSITSAIIMFIVIIIVNTFFIRRMRINSFEEKENSVKWYSTFGLTILFVFAICTALDYLYFYLIDNSISLEYAYGLESLLERSSPEKLESIGLFLKLPPFLQNYVTNTISLIVSSLFSTIIGYALSKAKTVYDKTLT